MTMNWYVAESLMAERNRDLIRMDGRRWPDVSHARRVSHRKSVVEEPRAARR